MNLTPPSFNSNSFIERIGNIIKSNQIQVVSFDFFDTLVKRNAPSPKEIFEVLAIHAHNAKILPLYISAPKFKYYRARYEEIARETQRKQNGSLEIRLEKVYSAMQDIFPTPALRQQMQHLEEKIEKDNIVVNSLAWELVLLAKKYKKKVIIVSDTYFDKDFLLSLLPEHKLIDAIYVSSEHGQGKGGGLFNMVINDLNLPPSSIFHIGDNYLVDVEIATKYGLLSYLLPNGTSTSWEIYHQEEKIPFHSKRTLAIDTLSISQGNILSCRNVSLLQSNGEFDFYSYGSYVLGPVLHSYISWVKTILIEEKINKVVGLMREGGFIADLLNLINIDHELEISKLYISRLTIKKCALSTINRENLKNLFPERQPISLKKFAERVFLKPSDFPDAWKEKNISSNDQNLMNQIIDFIIGNDRIKNHIQSEASEFRKNMRRHVNNVLGDTADNKIALIDLGWGGSIQRTLHSVFEIPKEQIMGLYLSINDGAINLDKDPINAAGFIFDGLNGDLYANEVLRFVEILEQACTPPVPSTVGYNRYGVPLFGSDYINPQQRDDIKNIQTGIHGYFKIAEDMLRCDLENYRTIAKNILIRSTLFPTIVEKKLFADWEHDDSFASGAKEKLTSEFFNSKIGYMTPQQILYSDFSIFYWTLGSTATKAADLGSSISQALLSGYNFSSSQHETKINCTLGFESPKTTTNIITNKYGRFFLAQDFNSYDFNGFLQLIFESSTDYLLSIDSISLVYLDSVDRFQSSVELSGEELRSASSEEINQSGLLIVSGKKNIQINLSAENFANSNFKLIICGRCLDIESSAINKQLIENKKSEIKLNIDNIFGHSTKDLIASQTSTIIDFDNQISILRIIDGWCFDISDKRAPDGGWVILKSTTDNIKTSIILTERKDVLEYYSLPSSKVGFKSSYDISLIEENTYTIGMLLRYGRNLIEIESPFELKIDNKTLNSFCFSVKRLENS